MLTQYGLPDISCRSRNDFCPLLKVNKNSIGGGEGLVAASPCQPREDINHYTISSLESAFRLVSAKNTDSGLEMARVRVICADQNKSEL